jgi:hypothetical protein
MNICIIKNSFLKSVKNERLKSRLKSRTRRVTTMLLVSNIGFLALVGPPQIFYAVKFNPEHGLQSDDDYRWFMTQSGIFQALINTYYAASFVFCFTSSSIFRREIMKLLHLLPSKKHSIYRNPNKACLNYDHASGVLQTRTSVQYYSNGHAMNDSVCGRYERVPPSESFIDDKSS